MASLGETSLTFPFDCSHKEASISTELRNLSLDNRKITDYLLHVQTLVDALTSIGDSVLQSEKVDVILGGFRQSMRPQYPISTTNLSLCLWMM